jgi:hypothetical protein
MYYFQESVMEILLMLFHLLGSKRLHSMLIIDCANFSLKLYNFFNKLLFQLIIYFSLSSNIPKNVKIYTVRIYLILRKLKKNSV